MEQLSKNNVISADIVGFSSQGDGIARVDGRAVFVKGALEGEKCSIKILKANKTAIFAKVEEILLPSPHRREPACVSFPKCGGCDFMHMSYEQELMMKRQRVADALKRIGGIDIEPDDIIGAENIYGYRNKVIYAVGGTAENPIIGFYRPRSHDIVPLDDCQIQPKVAANAAKALKNWMIKNKVSPYNKRERTGIIRHLYVRHGFNTGQTSICIVANTNKLPAKSELISNFRKMCPGTVSIVLNCNKSVGNTVLRGSFSTLWGNDSIEDVLCGLKFNLSTKSFYQINHAQAERLYEKVRELADLKGTEDVLDLYCGTGTITLHLARFAKSVIGAEIVEEAIYDANRNAENNNIKNARFIAGDASEAAETLAKEGLKPDVIVVDPPRKGLAQSVIETICRMSPKKVVYVSCDPATLSRDLGIFKSLGFCTKSVTPVDMFPRCAHVEAVALLTKGN